ncbi:hypothetical protein [Phenylobacterium sp.]|uniref:hypothetical protein n=1 Tax=Phenylobacterium sp. TaxID=1871053 RepID=UPI0025F148AD|nr:hypothetical protein [Phenylobacterium sp.]MBX3483911.1 hypothetical protein [Phenylobacterium sp.]MCW5760699.1 hypothetical protein [Phenylobacterium sp.]
MSALAALLLFATSAPALPAPAPPSAVNPPVRDVDQRAPIRCRPAPYYVSDVGDLGERQKPERILITGSRIPVREIDRRPRPCLLMRTMDVPAQNFARAADR